MFTAPPPSPRESFTNNLLNHKDNNSVIISLISGLSIKGSIKTVISSRDNSADNDNIEDDFPVIDV